MVPAHGRLARADTLESRKMTLQRKIGFWLIAFGMFVAMVYVLRDVMMPFAAGLVLAYLLDPLADRLEKLGIGRLGATLLILIVFVAVFVAVLVIAIPLFATQMMAFIEKVPGYVTRIQGLH
jgi:predicted PurR-regulated permease PerM